MRIKVKNTFFTMAVAFLMVFVLSCQTVTPSFLGLGGQNGSQTNYPTVIEGSEPEVNDKEKYKTNYYETDKKVTSTDGVKVQYDEFIKGYNVNGIDVSFEEGSLNGGRLYDSLLVDNNLFGEKFYLDDKLSSEFFSQYSMQYGYSEGKLKEIKSGGKTYRYDYDNDGRIKEIFKENRIYKRFFYNVDEVKIWESDEIFADMDVIYGKTAGSTYFAELDYEKGLGTVYKFLNEKLQIRYDLALANNRFWTRGYYEYNKAPQQDRSKYTYGYEHNEKQYMTGRIVGDESSSYYEDDDTNKENKKYRNYNYYSYEYINDLIVSETCNVYVNSKWTKSITTTYIFDNELRRVGFFYNNEVFHYVFDIFGNVEKLVDSNGNIAAEYTYSLFGEVKVTSHRKDNVENYNSYTFRALDNWYGDQNIGIYYVGQDKKFDIKSASFTDENSQKDLTGFITDPINNTIANGSVAALTKAPLKESLLKETLLKEKIVEITTQNLLAEDIKTYANTLVWTYGNFVTFAFNDVYEENVNSTEEKYSRGRADIYTVVDNSRNGSIFGSQVYIVSKNTGADLSYAENKLARLTDYSSYVFDEKNRFFTYSGEINFAGHFIYLNQYVTYKSTSGGVIAFDIMPNKPGSYNENYGNLYNFDTQRFVLFYGSNMKLEGIKIVSNVIYEVDWQKINDDLINELYDRTNLGCMVESISATYYSAKSLAELEKNSEGKITFFGGYDIEELKSEMGPDFVFTNKNGQTTVSQVLPKDQFDVGDFLTKIAIGTGIILLTATVITISGGSATPFVCFLATSATLTSIAVAGGVFAAGIALAKGGSMNDVLKGFSNGFLITSTVASTIAVTTGTGACFTAGTAIATAGGTKAIENIKAGDMVLSYNEKTKTTEYKKVLQTFTKKSQKTVNIITSKDDIITTPEHPFYVDGQWLKAKYIKAGDILQDENGEKVVVKDVRHEQQKNPLTVYNFEVEGNHNYYVGTGILVHNLCGTDAALNLLPVGTGTSFTLGKALLFAEIAAITFTVGGTMSLPEEGITIEESALSKARKHPRTVEAVFEETVTLDLDINYHIAYEVNYKFKFFFEGMSYYQALGFLYRLGLLKETKLRLGYYGINMLEIIAASTTIGVADGINDIPERKWGQEYHVGIYTEQPDKAFALAHAAGCSLNNYGCTMTAYLVATDKVPGYYHYRGPNDAFRVWFGYYLTIEKDSFGDEYVRWRSPLRQYYENGGK